MIRKYNKECLIAEKEYKKLKGEKGICGAKKDGFECTRKKGHEGNHHAHGYKECILKWNPRSNQRTP